MTTLQDSMSSPSSSPSPSPHQKDTTIPEYLSPTDLPLPLSTSILLTALPTDATTALATAGTFPTPKITVRFKPIGSAPLLRQQVCKISSGQRFEAVVAYLRRVLRIGLDGGNAARESVFCYVNSSFAPALDEVVGNLHRCFKDSNDQLIVTYSMTPAFG